MRYTDINCEKCGTVFTEDDDVVVCPVCGAPHHRSCWLETNACAHASEHENGYQWEMPKKEEPETEKKQTAPLHNEFILKNGESVIVCPRCGAMNCENDVYCMRCSFPLKEDAQSFPSGDDAPDVENGQGFARQAGQQQYYQRERMYDDFNRFGGIDPNAELDGIPVAEYSDYVGGKTPGKIIRKIAVMERFGKSISVCWPALIIGPIWFFWRKMIKEGILFSLILIALSTAAGFLQINAPLISYYNNLMPVIDKMAAGEISFAQLKEKFAEQENILAYSELTPEESMKEKLAAVCIFLADPGVPIACAAASMYFYRKKIKTSVLDIRQRCTNMDEYRSALRAEGGTSVGWAVIGVLLFIIARLCTTYLPLLAVTMANG